MELTNIIFSLLPLPLFFFFYQILTKTTFKKFITLIKLLRNRPRFLDSATELVERSPTHTITIGSPLLLNFVITANPLNVEHMLKTNFHNYPKGDKTISVLEDFLGHGIFNSDGDHWKLQRKAASLEFSTRSLRSFVVDIVNKEISNRLLPLLGRVGVNNETIDLQDVFERFGFDTICKLSLGDEAVPPEFMYAFADAQNLIVNRFKDPLSLTWKIKKLLNIGSERLLKQSTAVVHGFTRKMVELRRRKEKISDQDVGSDLLSRFATNEENSDEFLRDIVTSFILAGRETTSSALTWFFWLLSSRPDVEEKILEEIKSTRKQHEKFDAEERQHEQIPFNLGDVREMNYLHAAITEAMRLYPPVPADMMLCANDDVMPDGTFVGKGSLFMYSAYAMGRMESVWGPDCRKFKPERWLEEGVFRPESPFKFPVFHAGPRMCLGKEMAYIQMKSVAANLIERFDIRVMTEKGKDPEQDFVLTLKIKGGLPVRIREKSLM